MFLRITTFARLKFNHIFSFIARPTVESFFFKIKVIVIIAAKDLQLKILKLLPFKSEVIFFNKYNHIFEIERVKEKK